VIVLFLQTPNPVNKSTMSEWQTVQNPANPLQCEHLITHNGETYQCERAKQKAPGAEYCSYCQKQFTTFEQRAEAKDLRLQAGVQGMAARRMTEFDGLIDMRKGRLVQVAKKTEVQSEKSASLLAESASLRQQIRVRVSLKPATKSKIIMDPRALVQAAAEEIQRKSDAKLAQELQKLRAEYDVAVAAAKVSPAPTAVDALTEELWSHSISSSKSKKTIDEEDDAMEDVLEKPPKATGVPSLTPIGSPLVDPAHHTRNRAEVRAVAKSPNTSRKSTTSE